MLVFSILLERSSSWDMFQYALHILVLWTCTGILCRYTLIHALHSVHVAPYSECTTILNMCHYQYMECVLVFYAFTSILHVFQYIVYIRCTELSP